MKKKQNPDGGEQSHIASLVRGLMVQRVAPVKAQRAALAFRCEGDPGQTVVMTRQPQFLFRAEELFATDTSERTGRSTTIERVLIGNKFQPIVEVPTWMFSEYT